MFLFFAKAKLRAVPTVYDHRDVLLCYIDILLGVQMGFLHTFFDHIKKNKFDTKKCCVACHCYHDEIRRDQKHIRRMIGMIRRISNRHVIYSIKRVIRFVRNIKIIIFNCRKRCRCIA